MMGGFDLMAAMLDNQPKVQAAFRSGEGVAGAIRPAACSARSARFFRPGYHNNLVQPGCRRSTAWSTKLERGAKVADVGCGHGWSTVMMAKAFPNSTFVGYDFHPGSIEEAQSPRRGARRVGQHAFRGRRWRRIIPARTSTS